MKVFVSSTCYDLIDVRTELYEDLRDLGVSPMFSELKESEFRASTQAEVNSIETCLENVRSADEIIVILSQRYGRPIPAYGDKSATHVEYLEAINQKKPIRFFIRDRLIADWSAWRAADEPAKPKTTWAKAEQAKRLFDFMSERKKLADINNWYWPYTTSFDLRKTIRRLLEPDAYKAIAEKLVNAGSVPILLPLENGAYPEQNTYYFDYTVLNAGPIPAISVIAKLNFDGLTLDSDTSSIGAILPGNDLSTRGIRTFKFTVSYDRMAKLLARNGIEKGKPFTARLQLQYSAPSGHAFIDSTLLEMRMDQSNNIGLVTAPRYLGKTIGERRSPLS
jgi:hypothetical protein